MPVQSVDSGSIFNNKAHAHKRCAVSKEESESFASDVQRRIRTRHHETSALRQNRYDRAVLVRGCFINKKLTTPKHLYWHSGFSSACRLVVSGSNPPVHVRGEDFGPSFGTVPVQDLCRRLDRSLSTRARALRGIKRRVRALRGIKRRVRTLRHRAGRAKEDSNSPPHDMRAAPKPLCQYRMCDEEPNPRFELRAPRHTTRGNTCSRIIIDLKKIYIYQKSISTKPQQQHNTSNQTHPTDLAPDRPRARPISPPTIA